MTTPQHLTLPESLNILAGVKGWDAQGAAGIWANATGYDLLGFLNVKNGWTSGPMLGFDHVCTALMHATAAYATYPTGWSGQGALSILAGGGP